MSDDTYVMKHTPELYPDKAAILSAVNRMRRIMSGELPQHTPRPKSPKQCPICGGWIGRCKYKLQEKEDAPNKP